jgi:L-fuconolactonase
MQIIDSHVHIIDDPHYHGGNLSADELVQAMDSAGVDKAIIVQSISGNGLDSPLPVESARRYPDRLIAVSGCDALSHDPGDVMRFRITEWGARGIRLFWDGWDQNDRRFDGIWKAACDCDVPILLAGPGAKYEQLPLVVRRFPSLKLVLDYMVEPDLSEGAPARLLLLAGTPNITLKFFATYLFDQCENAGVSAPVLFEQLVSAFGADRMMWGSNYPSDHEPRWPYQRILDVSRALVAPYSASTQERLLSGTAKSLWPELSLIPAPSPAAPAVTGASP